MPPITVGKSHEELEECYTKLESMLMLTQAKDITIISENFNAKVGKDEVSNVVGDFSLGDKNERVDRLTEFGEHYGKLMVQTTSNM